MLNSLFINVTIFVSFLFVYYLLSLWMEGIKNRALSNLIIGTYFGGVGIGLMYFSASLPNGGMADLRHLVPIIITIYFGPITGIITAIIIVIGRITLFPLQPLSMIESLIILLITVLNISSYYSYIKRVIKFIVMIVVSIIVYFIGFQYFLGSRYETYVLFFYHSFATIFGGFFVFLVAEYMQRTKQVFRELVKESRTDYLTRLNNLREFNQAFEEMIKKAQRLNKPLSLILLDIDYFKMINDTYGHSVGNKVLKELGFLLQTNSRQEDIISRNGGEEFSIIMFNSSQQEAVKAAERIRNKIQNYTFHIEEDLTVNITVSMGVATFPETYPFPNSDGLFDQADKALYEAKRKGRNRVDFVK